MQVLAGFRVVDVSAYMFVPAAGAVLAHWGADVIKVEPAGSADPIRPPPAARSADTSYWHYNRGKRGIGLDLASPEGRSILYGLADRADVFLTSYLTDTRRKLHIDVDDIRARNPRIVYAKGTGRGPNGPEAERSGYDLATWWARGSLADGARRASGSEYPPGMTGHGDGMAGFTLAGGICAALLHRERTGEPSVVDGSLLGAAVWFNGPGIIAASRAGMPSGPGLARGEKDPLIEAYRTGDGRFVQLCMFSNSDAEWQDFMEHLGRTDVAHDPRFATPAARDAHRHELVAVLDELIGRHTYEALAALLAGTLGVWEPVQTAADVVHDPQVVANRYVSAAQHADGRAAVLPAPAIIFDGDPGQARPGPDWGEHTVEVLAELGMDRATVQDLQDRGVVR
ncbi:MAG: CaiB/BaiF CoA-transferase family protein [Acidimicrobiia bacterium]